MELLSRRELDVLNRKSLIYPLAVAEKDYFLAVVSKVIYDSSLRNKLVFKGGTAIYHCYLPQIRFSEDLDFTSLDKSISLEEVKTVLESQDFLEVKTDYMSKATIKIERLKYVGPLGFPNSLKIEIDFIQNVILPAKAMIYKNTWRVDTRVMVMDIREICAEKIRAASDRARYRDFYDLFLLLENFDFDMEEIEELIKQKEIRKPIGKKYILKNWKIANKEKEAELDRIHYARNISDSEIEGMIENLKLKPIQ
ncbi:MAG: hypothetical protein A2W05_07515 [Candidatus Schekmanbacteria bacterium RBG_16_38_10]|uniref:Nucleotidyl transferase AbiEii/AbiGii toxin family protein n=1 Tax=Candidatus Schekmanbacteria bacterium RBG_16_38_10 TaxID=1817879 RepID=A0A1F7S1F0_9BACT|nr:MAG: hypothetical protein A2W05_07515 [Candidatus Schekmanbacteria bacterium RBG_16_38_10]